MKNKIKRSILVFYCLMFFSAYQLKGQEVWQGLGCGLVSSGPYYGVYDLVVDTVRNYLYVGGKFDSAGCMKSHNLARWNVDQWETLNFGNVNSLCMYHNNLVVGFPDAGVRIYDSTGKYIGGFETNGPIYELGVYRDKLYAGGIFTEAGGIPVNNIVAYDGTISTVGGGVYWTVTTGSVSAMKVWNDRLYVGGSFDYAGGAPANFIAAWDETEWSALGSGTYKDNGIKINVGWINTLEVYKNNLYVGGEFDSAGGVYVSNIARWDGNNWFPVAGGTNGAPTCMVQKDVSLYVGGHFSEAGGITTSPSVARWDGMQWHNIGAGLFNGGTFYNFAVYNNELYGGGIFRGIYSGYTLNNIARLVNITNVNTPEIELQQSINIYPNPVTDKININASNESIEQVQVSNVLGQTILATKLLQGKKEIEINVNNLPQGMYLLRVKTKEGWCMGKFVKPASRIGRE